MAVAVKRKKILVEFPESLLLETEKVAHDLSTDRSKLIRKAVRAYLHQQEKNRLSRALAEGYQANAELDRSATAEFAYVDAENF